MENLSQEIKEDGLKSKSIEYGLYQIINLLSQKHKLQIINFISFKSSETCFIFSDQINQF